MNRTLPISLLVIILCSIWVCAAETDTDSYMTFGDFGESVAISDNYMYITKAYCADWSDEVDYFSITRIYLSTGEKEELIERFKSERMTLLSIDRGVCLISFGYKDEGIPLLICKIDNTSTDMEVMYSDYQIDAIFDTLVYNNQLILILENNILLFNLNDLKIHSVFTTKETITNYDWYNHACICSDKLYVSYSNGEIAEVNLADGSEKIVAQDYYSDYDGPDDYSIIRKHCGFRGYIVIGNELIYYNENEDVTYSKRLDEEIQRVFYNGKLSFRAVVVGGLYCTYDVYTPGYLHGNYCFIPIKDDSFDIMDMKRINYQNIPVILVNNSVQDNVLAKIEEECIHYSMW